MFELQSQLNQYSDKLIEQNTRIEKQQELYDKLYSLEVLALNHQKAEYFSSMNESLLASIIEYLHKLKYDALQLYHKKTNDLDGIMYANGIMSVLDSLLKFFATAKASKNVDKNETDRVTGEVVK